MPDRDPPGLSRRDLRLSPGDARALTPDLVSRRATAGCARPSEAWKALRNVLRIEAANAQAMRQLGLTNFQLGEMGQALRFLLRAQEGEPDNAEVRLKLASIYLMGRPDEAKHTLTKLTLKASDFLPA